MSNDYFVRTSTPGKRDTDITADAAAIAAALGLPTYPATLTVAFNVTGPGAFTCNVTVRVGGVVFPGAVVFVRVKTPVNLTSFGTDLGTQRGSTTGTTNNGQDWTVEIATSGSGVAQFNVGGFFNPGHVVHVTLQSLVPLSAPYAATRNY